MKHRLLWLFALALLITLPACGDSSETPDEFDGVYEEDSDGIYSDESDEIYVEDPDNSQWGPVEGAALDASGYEGTWLKNGDSSDKLVIESDIYREIMDDIEFSSYSWSLENDWTCYGLTGEVAYRGPILSMENGFSHNDYMCLEDGNVLYDDFNHEYCIREDYADTPEGGSVIHKYDMVCQDWTANSDASDWKILKFAFNGELLLFDGGKNGDGSAEAELAGYWTFDDDTVSFSFLDGSTESVAYDESLYLDRYGAEFFAPETW